MKKQNTLIVITFLIAVFFMGKYIWEVWPRYGIKESILTNSEGFKVYCYIEPHWDAGNCYTETSWFQKQTFNNNEIVSGGVLEERMKNVVQFFCEGNTCYIKEKVRIN